jgi:hypothetical protein
MTEAERLRAMDDLLCEVGYLALDADDTLIGALISEAQDAVLRRYSELFAPDMDLRT